MRLVSGFVLDLKLRSVKERLFSAPAGAVGAVVSANQLTMAGLVLTLAAAGSAAGGHTFIGLGFWAVSRIADGLDGAVARARGQASDLGGYSDQLVDTIGYAAVPLGVAMGVGTKASWIAVALLLGSFYVNSVSWLYLSAIGEKRGSGSLISGEVTTVTMPSALIEGTETIVFFSLFLIFPTHAHTLFGIMAAAVSIGVAQRFVRARNILAADDRSETARPNKARPGTAQPNAAPPVAEATIADSQNKGSEPID